MSEERRPTPEEEQIRLEGLRILARIIARRYLARSEVDAVGSSGEPETRPANGGQTADGNPGRKEDAA